MIFARTIFIILCILLYYKMTTLNAQQLFHSDIFHGGVTAGGFSTGLGVGSGVVNLHIESGQTDVSFSKIQQIAEILETDLITILNFDPKNIFNQCHNNNSVIAGNITTQNIQGNILDMLTDIKRDIDVMKDEMTRSK